MSTLTASDLLTPRTVQRVTPSTDGKGVHGVQRLAHAWITRWAHSDTGTRSVEVGLSSRETHPIVTRSNYLPSTEGVSVAMEQREYDDNDNATETELVGFLRVEEARKLHAQLGAALAEADAS